MISTEFCTWHGSYAVMSCAKLCLNPLRWRHNERDSVSNHQPHDCLLSRLIRRRSKKTSKLRVTGLCVGNSPGTGEFPTQMASYAENVSIWWRHHALNQSEASIWIKFQLRTKNHQRNMSHDCIMSSIWCNTPGLMWWNDQCQSVGKAPSRH